MSGTSSLATDITPDEGIAFFHEVILHNIKYWMAEDVHMIMLQY